MPSCVFRKCYNHSRHKTKADSVTFHSFPKDEYWKRKWSVIVRAQRHEYDWVPTSYSRVCSIHFKPEDMYTTNKGYKRIIKGVVPLIPSVPRKQIDDLQRDLGPSDNESTQEVDDDQSLYEHSESPVRTTGAEGSGGRHKGYRCDMCRRYIVGFRYTCVECPNFDLCCACEARGQHADHYVLRVPSSKPHSEVQAVVQKIRDELFKEDADMRVKVEVKVEECSDHEQDPLEHTAELLQDTSCQNIKCEESEESLAVKHLKLTEGRTSPVFEVQAHQIQVLTHRSEVQSHRPEDQSNQPEVQSHRPAVQSNQHAVQSHQPAVRSHQPEVQSHQPAVQSHQPAVQSHQPEVQSHPFEVQLEKKTLVLEVDGMDTLRVLARPGAVEGRTAEAGKGSYTMFTHSAHRARTNACAQSDVKGTKRVPAQPGAAQGSTGGEGKGSYAMFTHTHSAHRARSNVCTQSEEQSSSGEGSIPTRKKRKK